MRKFICLLAVILATTSWQLQTAEAQWVRVGLQGGRVSALMVVGSKVFAADFGGGIFCSDDSGTSWSTKNNGLTKRDVAALGKCRTRIFAATDSAGLFRSDDSGSHWTALLGWTSPHSVTSVADVDSLIFVGTDSGGVYRSSDNGMSWVAKNQGLNSSKILQVVTNGNDVFAVTSEAGVFRSSNGGLAWISASQGLLLDPYTGVKALYANDSILIGATRYGLFYSINKGRNWTNLHEIDTFKYGVYSIARSDSGVIVGANHLFRTTDLGLHWQRPDNINADVEFSNVYSLAVIGKVVLAGTESGVARSFDCGVTWNHKYYEARPFGPGAAQSVYCISQWGPFLFAGTGTAGLLRSSDSGVNWSEGIGLDINSANAFVATADFLFVATNFGGVYRSSDSGSSWSPLLGLTNSYVVTCLSVVGTVVLAGTQGGGLFRSSDNGETWIPTNSGLNSMNIHALLFKGAELFVGTAKGISHLSIPTTDWTFAGGGLAYDSLTLTESQTNVFAASPSGGVFRSTDFGATWTRPDSATTSWRYRHIRATTSNDSIVLAWPFYSRDEGVTWSAADSGMSYVGTRVNSVAMIGNYVYVGTENYSDQRLGGLWRRPLSDFRVVQQSRVGSRATLSAEIVCYPNPTTGLLTIESGATAIPLITVANILGETVIELPNPRTRDITLDLSKLPSGVYYVKVQTSAGVVVKQLLKE